MSEQTAPYDTEPDRRAFGLRIRHIREGRGETQASVAQALKVSRPFYSQVERGENNVSLEYVFRLANHFGVAVADLFAAQDAPNTPKHPSRQ